MAQATAAKNYAGVWDNRLGFGRKTALLVIDLLQGYTLKGAPLFAPGVVKAVAEMPTLLKLARAKKIGSPPTPRKARTGELTPPGMYLQASVNRLTGGTPARQAAA